MRTITLSRAIKTGLSSLMLHKLRSFLTTLGVLFGTSSVIAMLAIGEGASYEAQEQIKLLGSQNVILRSVKPPDDPNQGNGQTSRVVTYGITDADFERLEETFPGLGGVVPIRELAKEVRLNDRVMNPRVMATRPSYQQVTGRLLAEGRFLSEEDDRTLQNVCVLGTEVARFLFPFETPIGKRVKIGGDYFTVVGTLAPRIRAADDQAPVGTEVTGEVYIPFETARKWYGKLQVKQRAGSREMEEVDLHEVVLAVRNAPDVPMIANAAREMLSRFHEDKRDYEVVVPLELLARAEETKRIFNIVLGSIAGISLLVAGYPHLGCLKNNFNH